MKHFIGCWNVLNTLLKLIITVLCLKIFIYFKEMYLFYSLCTTEEWFLLVYSYFIVFVRLLSKDYGDITWYHRSHIVFIITVLIDMLVACIVVFLPSLALAAREALCKPWLIIPACWSTQLLGFLSRSRRPLILPSTISFVSLLFSL